MTVCPADSRRWDGRMDRCGKSNNEDATGFKEKSVAVSRIGLEVRGALAETSCPLDCNDTGDAASDRLGSLPCTMTTGALFVKRTCGTPRWIWVDWEVALLPSSVEVTAWLPSGKTRAKRVSVWFKGGTSEWSWGVEGSGFLIGACMCTGG